MRIGICAPSTPIFREDADKVQAIAAIQFPDVQLDFHDQCFAVHGHFAGSDAVRTDALVGMANDPSYDAIWFARGGYGAGRIAEAAIKRFEDTARDKVYLGYSDAGFLLSALYKAGTGHVAHGPMPADVKRIGGNEAIRRALRWLTRGAKSSMAEEVEPDTPTVALNLTILSTMIATPLLCDLSGHILMVEEVAEYEYAIDRALFHVTRALGSAGLVGLRLGRATDIPTNDRPFGETIEQMAIRCCEEAGIAYLGRADIGHDVDNKVVPFGLASRWPLP